jgi:DNA repair protein RecO (recombination protein O)
MSSEKATALILRTVDFSESSLVVTLFTREFGKISAMAKGGRRIKGPFESALDLMARIRVVFLRKSSGALDLLTEAKLERRFRPDKENLAGLYAGYYVVELLRELTHEYEPMPELFDLTEATLLALPTERAIALRVSRYELRMLDMLGYMPSLKSCVHCGVDAQGGRWTSFGLNDGGVLCPKCKAGRGGVVRIDPSIVGILQRLNEPDDVTWKETALTPRNKGQLRGLLNAYVCRVMGKRPRMHEHVGALFGKAKTSSKAFTSD